MVRSSQRLIDEAMAPLGSGPPTPAHHDALPSGPTTKARCGPKFWKSAKLFAASALSGGAEDWAATVPTGPYLPGRGNNGGSGCAIDGGKGRQDMEALLPLLAIGALLARRARR